MTAALYGKLHVQHDIRTELQQPHNGGHHEPTQHHIPNWTRTFFYYYFGMENCHQSSNFSFHFLCVNESKYSEASVYSSRFFFKRLISFNKDPKHPQKTPKRKPNPIKTQSVLFAGNSKFAAFP
jgi:hypothetical protein